MGREKIIYNEKELLLRISDGDQGAFRQVFEMQERALQYFAEKLLEQRAEAEDVVLMAFQKLWERRATVTSMQSMRSFLYTTVRNQCLDVIKHRQVVQHVHRELIHAAPAGTNYDEYRMLQGELLNLIYAEIRQLPVQQRQVLEWSFLEDIPTAEIARRLSLTESSVRSARTRALARLRSVLREKRLLETAFALLALWHRAITGS